MNKSIKFVCNMLVLVCFFVSLLGVIFINHAATPVSAAYGAQTVFEQDYQRKLQLIPKIDPNAPNYYDNFYVISNVSDTPLVIPTSYTKNGKTYNGYEFIIWEDPKILTENMVSVIARAQRLGVIDDNILSVTRDNALILYNCERRNGNLKDYRTNIVTNGDPFALNVETDLSKRWIYLHDSNNEARESSGRPGYIYLYYDVAMYKITFRYMDVNGVMGSHDTYLPYGAKVEFPEVPLPAGATAYNWPYDNNITVINDLEFTVNYTWETYSITFLEHDDTPVRVMQLSRFDAFPRTVSAKDYTEGNKRYTFDGWTTVRGSEDYRVDIAKYQFMGDTTFYPLFKVTGLVQPDGTIKPVEGSWWDKLGDWVIGSWAIGHGLQVFLICLLIAVVSALIIGIIIFIYKKKRGGGK